jgi:hypothetical protein
MQLGHRSAHQHSGLLRELRPEEHLECHLMEHVQQKSISWIKWTSFHEGTLDVTKI